MKVAVVGTGYVGAVTAAGLAAIGHEVTAVDSDRAKIDAFLRGKPPFYEPGLDDLVKVTVGRGRLHFTTDLAEAVCDAEVTFLCVGTPSRHDGEADLSAVFEVAERLRDLLGARPRVIAVKSTVPVGTNDALAQIVGPHMLVSNPEFLAESTALCDFFDPDRIVLGIRDGQDEAEEILRRLYLDSVGPTGGMIRLGDPHDSFIVTDTRSAELCKYASNAHLAMRVSWANEIAQLCEKAGADVREVTRIVGEDRRIGRAFLRAGVGYGGSCFSKDLAALSHLYRRHGLPAALLAATQAANTRARLWAVQCALAHFGRWSIKGKKIALLGLAFKPHTDDVRDAPALGIVHGLFDAGVIVSAYDPMADETARTAFVSARFPVLLAGSVEETLHGADAAILVTEWPEFTDIPIGGLPQVVIDGRNALDGARIRASGRTYYGVGQGGP